MPKHTRSPVNLRTLSEAAPKTSRHSGKRVAARSGPGRPTAVRVEAINRAILAKALIEFTKSGYEDARMEAIAKAAGISKATLYVRYQTKEELLKAVIAEHVAAWTTDWGSTANSVHGDLRARLKHRVGGLMEFLCSGQLDLLEHLLTTSPAMVALRRMRYEVGHQRTAQVIAQEIIECVEEPIQLRTATQLAEMLIGMIYGWWKMHQEARRVTLEEALAYADHAVDVLFEGRSAWAQSRS